MGYEFLGWSAQYNARQPQYLPGQEYTEDVSVKLYAVWKTRQDVTYQPPTSAPAQKEGCYIATAVYGSYEAPEVMVLRRFRDDVLKRSVAGRWFVRLYYRFSPAIAEKLKGASTVNRFVKGWLDRLVAHLNQQ